MLNADGDALKGDREALKTLQMHQMAKGKALKGDEGVKWRWQGGKGRR